MAHQIGRQIDKDGTFWDHDPRAAIDYGVDWSDWLAESGDAIASIAFSVDPSGPTLYNTNIVGDIAVVWVSGGVVNTEYTLRSQVFTNSNPVRKNARTFRLKMMDL